MFIRNKSFIAYDQATYNYLRFSLEFTDFSLCLFGINDALNQTPKATDIFYQQIKNNTYIYRRLNLFDSNVYRPSPMLMAS